ncbi:hypothetical protein C8Q75DRAFT_733495 [Abortiporus biennis]|nr:hypothetical protein C8Q75DRAFT_733495 [Abortiporus biennis]
MPDDKSLPQAPDNSDHPSVPPPAYSYPPGGGPPLPPSKDAQASYPPMQYAGQSQPQQQQYYAVQPQVTGGMVQQQSTGVHIMQPQMTGGGIPQQERNVGSQFQNEYGMVRADSLIGSVYARCARGDHDVVKKYGPCGIITAIFCFPIGLIALCIDYEERCARCGVRVGGATVG